MKPTVDLGELSASQTHRFRPPLDPHHSRRRLSSRPR